MPPKKHISNISGSAVVDLKAELYRTQEEYTKEKLKASATVAENGGAIPVKSTKVYKLYEPKLPPRMSAKRDAAAGKGRDADDDAGNEEHNKLQAAYVALQRKAVEYDRRRREAAGGPVGGEPSFDAAPASDRKRQRVDDDDDDDEFYTTNVMVDFTAKSATDKGAEVVDQVARMVDGDDGIDPWVETVDQFGRTKIVRRSQAEEMKKMGAPSFVRGSDGDGAARDAGDDAGNDHMPSMLSADMQREQERTEWEANARMQMEESNERPLDGQHYNPSKEPRTLGVGYYAFSKDEEQRQQQMQELKRLREETVKRRSNVGSAKMARLEKLEERKAMLRERRKKKLESFGGGGVDGDGLDDSVTDADTFFATLQ